jgi:chitin synthase
MFTSLLQYLCLAPSFVNVLNVYAFCNLHDVSWGTKGSDKVEALPSIKSKSTHLGDAERAVEDTTKVQEDVDACFEETVTRALKKIEANAGNEKPTLDDENRTFRTRLITMWMLTNGLLAIAIENLNGWLNIDAKDLSASTIQAFEAKESDRRNTYFSIVLYATFGLALIRFTGVSLSYISCLS